LLIEGSLEVQEDIYVGDNIQIDGSLLFKDEIWLLGSTADNIFGDSVGFRNSQNNERTTLRIMPQGTVTDGKGASNLEFFGTDFIGDSTNWERMKLRADTSLGYYELFTEKGGTGTLRPLHIYTSGNSSQIVCSTDGTVSLSGILNATASGLRTIKSVADVSDPPTDAELDTAFGDPTTVDSGFIGILDDNDAGTDCYICWTTGTAGEWFYTKGTKAV
jgi:hypothetical protein